MKPDAAGYLAKRANLDRWPLRVDSQDDVDTVVVIPCLGERESLPHTLESLAQNDPTLLRRTLAICVVNNRAPQYARAGDIENNQETLGDLEAALDGGLRLGFVDASSPGCELPEKDGVGLARKIGLDWGVSVSAASAEPVLCCLDADTLVEPNYLGAVRDALRRDDAWAGVVHFEHVLPDDPAHREAIVAYECFLRCHVHGLRAAGSPYAFHTVGSTMVCTPEAYVAVSGMNRKQAAEDFYFLQQLAKTGSIQPIGATTVHPSARASHRVPFGTGRSITQALDGESSEKRIYNPASYEIVRACLEIPSKDPRHPLAQLKHPELIAFLRTNDFEAAWNRIQLAGGAARQRTLQFHTWFDAFRTLKLLHHLRDNGYPNVGAAEAAAAWGPTGAGAQSFLMWLRDRDRSCGSKLGLHA